ncbi:MAG: DUF937 domain-containing protein [Proteobacteria bacterium]|nr:DUF937 domain-containing protein [Pseudomonadota bacterium]
MGAEAFSASQGSGAAGSSLDANALISALSSLTSSSGGLDIGSLISNMQSGDLGDILQSWLGNGQNAAISGQQVIDVLGSNKISDFASQLGLSRDEAIGGLQDALPKMVDNASSDGSLLDSIGGIEGAIGLASKLFR